MSLPLRVNRIGHLTKVYIPVNIFFPVISQLKIIGTTYIRNSGEIEVYCEVPLPPIEADNKITIIPRPEIVEKIKEIKSQLY